MDWLRAKVVLIAAFLLLDAVLAYQVTVRERWEPSYVALPSAAQVRAELERFCLRLAEPLPEAGAAPERLQLRPRPAPEALLSDLVPADAQAAPVTAPGGGRVYRWPGGRAWYTAGGWLVFAATAAGGEPPGEFGRQEAREEAEGWLRKRGALPEDLVLAGPPTYQPRRGGYELRWLQRAAGGLPLLEGEGGVRVVMARARVLELEWQLWDWQDSPGAGPAAVLPATRVLARELRPGGAVAALGAGSGPCRQPRPVAVRLGYRVESTGAGGRVAEARLVWRVEAAGAVLDYDAASGRRLPLPGEAAGP